MSQFLLVSNGENRTVIAPEEPEMSYCTHIFKMCTRLETLPILITVFHPNINYVGTIFVTEVLSIC